MPNAKLDATPLPFGEQIRYFAKKINLPTEHYTDIDSQLHDYAFVVAGANTMQMVQDFRQIVDKAIVDGITLEQFKKDFGKIAPNWHRGRSRTVYDTNLYSSYNYGRYEQQKQLADVMPYWQYQHHDNTHPRPEHQRLDNLVLRADDPFWDDYYPTKAYGCHCTVQALDDVDLSNQGLTVSDSPQIEWEEKTVGIRSGNPKTVRVPKGVDVGFEHKKRLVPVHKVDEILLQKLVDNDTKTAALMGEAILRHQPAIKMLKQSFAEMVDRLDMGEHSKKIVKYVGVIPNAVIAKLQTLGKAPQTAVIAMRDDDIAHALRDLKKSKGINMPVEFLKDLPEHLQNPKAILLQPKEMDRNPDAKDTLLFIYDTERGKVVVKLDYETEVPNLATGKKKKVALNLVRTASKLKDLTGIEHFVILWER